ncbi:MAG: polysaccharide biosynthesis C-terminal domain-containing protein [Sulfolobales archaeon]
MERQSKRFSIGKVVAGGFWLYLSSIIDNFSGFIYWMIVSALVGPTAIGIASTISSLSGLITSFLGLGIGTGVIRFFGMFLGSDDKDRLRAYFWTTYIFNLLIHLGVGVFILLLGFEGYEFSGITNDMFIFTSFMVIAGLNSIPSSLVTSMLRTEVIFVSVILSIFFRFAVGITLISYYSLGWVGAVIGNLIQLYTRLVIINLYSFRKVPIKIGFSYKALREVLIAGIPSWLPGLITSIGSLTGILSVYAVSGALETGYYYVSSAIANIILMIGTTILSLTFPVLSGMDDGRKRALSQVLKISIALIAPPSIYVMFYSWVPLSWLGSEYVNSAPVLTTLLLSSIPLAITSGVGSLVYAYGKYSLILAINMVTSIVRMVLYYILIPEYGGLGSAISFTIGSYAGFLVTLYVAKMIRFIVEWRLLVETVTIPLILGGVCFVLNVHWLITLTMVASSYIIYLKSRIIGRKELREIMKALHMESLAIKVYNKYGDIINKILGQS